MTKIRVISSYLIDVQTLVKTLCEFLLPFCKNDSSFRQNSISLKAIFLKECHNTSSQAMQIQ